MPDVMLKRVAGLLTILVLLFHGVAMAMEEEYTQKIWFVKIKKKIKEKWKGYLDLYSPLFAMVELTYFPREFSYRDPLDESLDDSYNYTKNSVLVEFVQSQKNTVLKEQYEAYKYFLENEQHIAEKVKPIVYSFYKKIHPAFVSGLLNYPDPPSIDEIEATFPKIVKGDELRDRVGLMTIKIHPPQEGISTIALCFYWSFEDEGVTVHIKEDEVVYMGDIEDPFLLDKLKSNSKL